jgi:hypothetical protein
MLNSKKNHYLCSALQMANNMKTRALLVILLMTICFIVKAADGTTTYNCILSDIQMNDKTFPALPDKTFTLTLSSADKGVIDGEVGRIGKMPGTLHFTIPVTLAPNGTLKAAKGIEAGKMTMNIGLTRKLVTEDFSGSVRDGQLHFVLHVTSSMLGITMADATLTFDGELK